MRAFALSALALPLALLAACGSPRDRAGCAASTDCPRGEYCARTADGNVCWPDAVPPTVAAVTATCLDPLPGGACPRDGTLRVAATISDDAEVLGADVALDVGGPAVPLARSGGQWTADVRLARVPFDHFAHGVVATVTARDGARNEASLDPAEPTTVTRLRWERAVDPGTIFGLGHPAVMQDGTVVAAGTNGKVYFLAWDGSALSSVAVGTGQITAAPLALGTSVWIGSEDNKVYEVADSGAVWQPTVRTDDTGGKVLGSLSLSSDNRTLATTESGFLYVATSAGYKSGAVILPFALGPVVNGESIFAVAGGALKRLTIVLGASSTDSSYSCQFGFEVTHPLAYSAGVTAVVSNGTDGFVRRCGDSAGDPEHLATTAIPSGGAAVPADGSILVPEQTKTLSRWNSAGAAFSGWQKPDLGGATRTPLVLSSAVPFVVPTSKGAVYGLRPDGSVAWSGQLSAGTASLQPGNIYTYTPPATPADETMSLAYFAGSDGVLHAVIVDGQLDASAPWPKAFHDPRNTNRAGAQP